jgi:hypothetical protein
MYNAHSSPLQRDSTAVWNVWEYEKKKNFQAALLDRVRKPSTSDLER